MYVKICGTTNLPDAELAVTLGVDALGFIFAPSKRRVTVEQAAAITSQLPLHIDRVGVFTEANVFEIVSVVRTAHLSAVQLHMSYDPALIQQLTSELRGEVRLWQVLGFEVQPANPAFEEEFAERARIAFADARLSAVLVDTVKNGASGGMGVPFPWLPAASLLQQAQLTASHCAKMQNEGLPRLILAGGLHAGNVGGAIAALDPWGVDVVSGVEERPGRKSHEKLRDFMQSVRRRS